MYRNRNRFLLFRVQLFQKRAHRLCETNQIQNVPIGRGVNNSLRVLRLLRLRYFHIKVAILYWFKKLMHVNIVRLQHCSYRSYLVKGLTISVIQLMEIVNPVIHSLTSPHVTLMIVNARMYIYKPIKLKMLSCMHCQINIEYSISFYNRS